MDRTKEFADKVRMSLNKLSKRLKRVLKRLAEYKFDPAVRLLLFEVFPSEFTSGFPVRLFFYDAGWNEYFIQVNGKWEYPCDIDPDLINIKQVYDWELEREYNKDVEDPWSLAVDTLIEWFSECWQEAEANRCELPAWISQHDSSRFFDLKQKKWINQSEVNLS